MRSSSCIESALAARTGPLRRGGRAAPSRRALLRGLSASPLAALLGPGLLARADTGAPRRLVIIHKPCGTVVSQFFPPSAGASETTLSLPFILQPFEALKSEMVILERVSAPRLESWPGDAHSMGMITMMTGRRAAQLPGFGQNGDSSADSEHIAGADRSIDQVLAAGSPILRGTRFPSLQLTASAGSAAGAGLPGSRVLSYSGPGASGALWPEARPAQVVTRLFSGLMGTGAEGDAAALRRLQARRKSVLDHVAGDLARMMNEVPRGERARLEEHVTAIAQLVRQTDASAPVAAGCAAPTLNGSAALEDHAAASRQMLQILRAAFQCDLTRVATITFAGGLSGQSFDRIISGLGSADGHHDVSHEVGPAGVRAMAAIDRWYSERVAEFLIDLKNTPDGPGASLLDNTLVVYFTDVSDSNGHDATNMPVVLFGAKALGLVRGRIARLNDRFMNDVWVSVARAFQAPVETFGDATFNRGAAPGLFA